ncbi:MAG: lipid-binding SYLF domain-containing protein [Desulfobacula sp.]|jgi:lipid-binding SYLF domain-containing protein|uniref:lipid-binding SYLF domain-containing protein n=1 Tax=Desulfobacula sp. TaxID=2593537 RepID=UPI001E1AE2A8|nr:lipid-binding SYLF domain-containing protein [Desulfobacula sp.]MBT3484897.1 lipid-binding SYLF domain-containing protein [Desulfobacula sp.]MBT3803267.1 lipid-binding SYLF domain-containing protein [Desulfobacula sp.]MBT4024650.1 lipid-binding SYLF domain-containing protein [Desulfobacula sp.]MBT4200400.1 lipid-binding SYLF domain-containing protein [Desulfobacula sp.]
MKLIPFKLALLFTILLLLISSNAMADKYSDTIDVFIKSDAVKPFFNEAYGYAVFPRVGKGGIILGGAYGAGRVFKQRSISGTAALMKISVGFQLGGQAFSEIIFFEDKRAYNEFTSGTFEFDGSLSAVLITTAAQAQAGTQGSSAGVSLGPATGTQAEANYTKGMAVFIHTLGGLMYEMSIGGQKFSFTPAK